MDGSPATHTWTVEAPPPDCGTGTVNASILADSWVDQGSPAQNKGTDSILKLMSKGPANNVRSLVRFSTPTMPAGCAVKSATLRLYSSSYQGGQDASGPPRDGQLGRGRRDLENQPSTAGTPATAPSRSSAGYVEWDVRWQLQAMYDAGAQQRLPDPRRHREPGRRAAVPQP